MSSNVVNQMPFLRTSREFPEDGRQLTVEVSKTYIDIANNVNNRTIGLFPTSNPALNGESWFVTNNQKQQGFRQVYTFISVASPIPHNISNVTAGQFIRCFGEYTDGTKTYGLIYGNAGVAIAGQIVFDVSSTQIEFISGAGTPTVKSGMVVLEWISMP